MQIMSKDFMYDHVTHAKTLWKVNDWWEMELQAGIASEIISVETIYTGEYSKQIGIRIYFWSKESIARPDMTIPLKDRIGGA